MLPAGEWQSRVDAGTGRVTPNETSDLAAHPHTQAKAEVACLAAAARPFPSGSDDQAHMRGT